MKRVIFGLMMFMAFSQCTTENKNTVISGAVDGLKKGHLLVQELSDTLLVTLDSIHVEGNARFTFNIDLTEPQVLYLALIFQDSVTQTKYIPFFAEPGIITVDTSLENYEVDYTITGSKNEALWNDYRQLMSRYKQRKLDYIKEELSAMQTGNVADIETWRVQQQKLMTSRYLATVNFAKNHQDMAIAPYLMLLEIPDVNPNYHDTIFKLLRPEIKNSKYGIALESFILQQN